MSADDAPVLEVTGLTITTRASARLVDDVSFRLNAGQRLALIGESGSGKSLTSLAIMGLLPDGVTATGSIRLGDTEIVGAPERTLGRVRGRAAGIVFQEPLTALDPLTTLGRQLAEPIARTAAGEGRRLSRSARNGAVTAALAEVSMRDPQRIARSFPHEVSGGQRQRVAIAMALAGRPRVLIADEPTTALDVTVQAEVLELLDRVTAERGTALLFVSHDLAVVARMASHAIVLQSGRVVEQGTVAELLSRPQHDYTRRLVGAARELDGALSFGDAR
jgi:peptide/nickel transport system ATP-binding protein